MSIQYWLIFVYYYSIIIFVNLLVSVPLYYLYRVTLDYVRKKDYNNFLCLRIFKCVSGLFSKSAVLNSEEHIRHR